MKMFFRQLRPALVALVLFTVLCGVVYPLVVFSIGQVFFREEANGSLLRRNGVVVGSKLIGQHFTSTQYFAPRPSAAGSGYDASVSSGSNLGPRNPVLLNTVAQRVTQYRSDNALSAEVMVPVDAVTASGSGLDPHISVANARLQAPRVAAARNMSLLDVLALIEVHTDHRQFVILGEPGVNVLELNVALDAAQP